MQRWTDWMAARGRLAGTGYSPWLDEAIVRLLRLYKITGNLLNSMMNDDMLPYWSKYFKVIFTPFLPLFVLISLLLFCGGGRHFSNSALFGFASPSPGVGLEQCGGSGDQTLGKLTKSAPFNFAIQLIRQLRAKSLKKIIAAVLQVNLTIILLWNIWLIQ